MQYGFENMSNATNEAAGVETEHANKTASSFLLTLRYPEENVFIINS